MCSVGIMGRSNVELMNGSAVIRFGANPLPRFDRADLSSLPWSWTFTAEVNSSTFPMELSTSSSLMTASFGHGILLQHLILISAFPCVRGGLGLVVHVDGVPRDPDPGGVEDNLISELISSNLDLR